MPNRAIDWLNQAEGDLGHSKNARKSGDYDWACFAAQQAAEKAVEGLILSKYSDPLPQRFRYRRTQRVLHR